MTFIINIIIEQMQISIFRMWPIRLCPMGKKGNERYTSILNNYTVISIQEKVRSYGIDIDILW